LVGHARGILDRAWETISAKATKEGEVPDVIEDAELVEAIKRSSRSRTRTYHYVLTTQLVAKLAAPSLDCRCLQASRGGEGAFDARTIAHNVIVPFDRANNNVLGGSPEPYVNNPLRVPEVSDRYAGAQRNQSGWADLCFVLHSVQERNDPTFTNKVFMQVLLEIHRRLQEVTVVYPVPIRISLKQTIDLLEEFMGEYSGGDRALAVASALFVLIGRRFGLYADVRRAAI
jgi:hypothetical protein